jgi:hypothetical protein
VDSSERHHSIVSAYWPFISAQRRRIFRPAAFAKVGGEAGNNGKSAEGKRYPFTSLRSITLKIFGAAQ